MGIKEELGKRKDGSIIKLLRHVETEWASARQIFRRGWHNVDPNGKVA